jgi:hypothetical protein
MTIEDQQVEFSGGEEYYIKKSESSGKRSGVNA